MQARGHRFDPGRLHLKCRFAQSSRGPEPKKESIFKQFNVSTTLKQLKTIAKETKEKIAEEMKEFKEFCESIGIKFTLVPAG